MPRRRPDRGGRLSSILCPAKGSTIIQVPSLFNVLGSRFDKSDCRSIVAKQIKAKTHNSRGRLPVSCENGLGDVADAVSSRILYEPSEGRFRRQRSDSGRIAPHSVFAQSFVVFALRKSWTGAARRCRLELLLGQVVNALLLLEIIQLARFPQPGFLQLSALNRSTCDSSDRQLYALGAATLVFCISWIRRMAALVTDVPAIDMSDHGTKLEA